MKTKRIAVLAACATLALVIGAQVAPAGTAPRDRILRTDNVEFRPMTNIAVLPAVSATGDEVAERRAEFAWVRMYANARTTWMPADEVRRRLAAASGGSGDLEAAVEAQIWRDGAVEGPIAARLARLLGVDGVLSLRVDLWEIADGGRGMVALTACIAGGDGQELWRASGLAGHGRGRLSNEGNFAIDNGTFRCWDARLEPDESAHRTAFALYTLLARWAPALPMPMFERDLPPGLIAMLKEEK